MFGEDPAAAAADAEARARAASDSERRRRAREIVGHCGGTRAGEMTGTAYWKLVDKIAELLEQIDRADAAAPAATEVKPLHKYQYQAVTQIESHDRVELDRHRKAAVYLLEQKSAVRLLESAIAELEWLNWRCDGQRADLSTVSAAHDAARDRIAELEAQVTGETGSAAREIDSLQRELEQVRRERDIRDRQAREFRRAQEQTAARLAEALGTIDRQEQTMRELEEQRNFAWRRVLAELSDNELVAELQRRLNT